MGPPATPSGQPGTDVSGPPGLAAAREGSDEIPIGQYYPPRCESSGVVVSVSVSWVVVVSVSWVVVLVLVVVLVRRDAVRSVGFRDGSRLS